MKVKTKVRPEPVEQLPKRPRLDQWYTCQGECDWGRPYQHLHGVVHGHPRLPDGLSIATSKLVYLTPPVAQTQNTLYELMEPRR